MKRLSAFAFLLLAIAAASAQTSDDQYVQIFSGIQAADSLYDNSQTAAALAQYINAQAALQRFQKGYPEWNPGIVRFRLDYLAGRIQELRAKLPAGASIPAPTPVTPADPAQLKSQVGALSEQVRQLQADKSILEAKLRESLSVQPAAADPRELARAEQRIKTLEKENDLLQVLVDQAKTKAATGEPADLDQLKSMLAEANSKLAREAEKAASLEKEKQALKQQLGTLVPDGWNDATIGKTTKDLNDANQQIAEQKELIVRLGAEREALQTRLKEAAGQTEAMAVLKAENELLKKHAAENKTGAAENAAPALTEARAQIATLQLEKDTLRLEKTALETRVKQLQTAASQSAIVPFSSATKEETKRIQQLERDKDDLQKKLDKATKQAASLSKKKGQGEILQQLQGENASLKSRIAVLDAQKIPYSAEELALMKGSPTRLAAATDTRRPISQLPAGSAGLVAQAQRDFAARRFDKAEETYQEILKKDENNPLTLANLASIQLERGRLDEAEKNANKAIAQAPEDPIGLRVLGEIKFKQKQFDAALDCLSRAATIDPDNAELQNVLGLTLSEKGMRGPAETALRKAVQLRPNYAEAHNNLAVVYLTQKPPLLELARWHYQKANSAGGSNPALLQMIEAAEKAASKK